MTPEFQRVYRSLEACGESNACGPLALTIMSGQPVEIVRDVLRRCGRREGRGTIGWVFLRAAQMLGLKLRDLPAGEAIRRARAGRRVFLFTDDHVFAVTDGRPHDPFPLMHLPRVCGGVEVLN